MIHTPVKAPAEVLQTLHSQTDKQSTKSFQLNFKSIFCLCVFVTILGFIYLNPVAVSSAAKLKRRPEVLRRGNKAAENKQDVHDVQGLGWWSLSSQPDGCVDTQSQQTPATPDRHLTLQPIPLTPPPSFAPSIPVPFTQWPVQDPFVSHQCLSPEVRCLHTAVSWRQGSLSKRLSLNPQSRPIITFLFSNIMEIVVIATELNITDWEVFSVKKMVEARGVFTMCHVIMYETYFQRSRFTKGLKCLKSNDCRKLIVLKISHQSIDKDKQQPSIYSKYGLYSLFKAS